MLGPARAGVLLAEYHHRPSDQGESDDAQHRHHYQGSRDPDGALPRSHLRAGLHAQAADVRRAVLLSARSSRPSDSVARVVSSHARPLCHRDQGVRRGSGGPAHRIRVGARQRCDRRRRIARASDDHDGVVVIGVSQEKARAFKAHKRAGPQGERHLRLHPPVRSRSITTTSTAGSRSGARRSSRSARMSRIRSRSA